MNSFQPSGYYKIVRKILFSLDPEKAHNITFSGLKLGHVLGMTKILGASTSLNDPVCVMGLEFPNRLGLAAGLDKDGIAVDGLGDLGFGSIEVGTVTPLPQPGNPKPRLFRIPGRGALINRMGFNNDGVDMLLENLDKIKYKGILGINIGKQFTTPVDEALGDYIIGLKKVFEHAGYIAINISSPNTPDLRKLQDSDALDHLLTGLKKEHDRLCEEHKMYKPMAIKVAPDMEMDQIRHIGELLLKHKIDGLIATNTTISRKGIDDLAIAAEDGGMSGAPLTQKSTEVIEKFADILAGRIPIIAAGGIMSGSDAKDKLDAGASLVQIYSGFIYRGPALIKEILKEIKA